MNKNILKIVAAVAMVMGSFSLQAKSSCPRACEKECYLEVTNNSCKTISFKVLLGDCGCTKMHGWRHHWGKMRRMRHIHVAPGQSAKSHAFPANENITLLVREVSPSNRGAQRIEIPASEACDACVRINQRECGEFYLE